MARPSKKKQEETAGTPIIAEAEPVIGEPSKLFRIETDRTKNNVVPITTSSEPVQTERDWTDTDSILSDVVTFV